MMIVVGRSRIGSGARRLGQRRCRVCAAETTSFFARRRIGARATRKFASRFRPAAESRARRWRGARLASSSNRNPTPTIAGELIVLIITLIVASSSSAAAAASPTSEQIESSLERGPREAAAAAVAAAATAPEFRQVDGPLLFVARNYQRKVGDDYQADYYENYANDDDEHGDTDTKTAKTARELSLDGAGSFVVVVGREYKRAARSDSPLESSGGSLRRPIKWRQIWSVDSSRSSKRHKSDNELKRRRQQLNFERGSHRQPSRLAASLFRQVDERRLESLVAARRRQRRQNHTASSLEPEAGISGGESLVSRILAKIESDPIGAGGYANLLPGLEAEAGQGERTRRKRQSEANEDENQDDDDTKGENQKSDEQELQLIELLAKFYAHTKEVEDKFKHYLLVQRSLGSPVALPSESTSYSLDNYQNQNQVDRNLIDLLTSGLTRDQVEQLKMQFKADENSLALWLREQQNKTANSSLASMVIEIADYPNRSMVVCSEGPKILVKPDASRFAKCYTESQWIDKLWADLRLSTFHYPIIVFNLLIFLFGTTGNVFVCLSVRRNHQLRNVTNYFIVNLAFADFLVILICLPATALWDLYLTWFFGTIPCKLIMFLQDVSISVSVLTLTAISIDRYYAICHPLKFKSSLNQAKRMIALIWFVSLLTMSPDLMYLSAKRSQDLIESGIDTVLYSDCNYDWSEDSSKLFQFVKTILLYLLPFLLMFCAHFKILQALRLASTMALQELKSLPFELASQQHAGQQASCYELTSQTNVTSFSPSATNSDKSSSSAATGGGGGGSASAPTGSRFRLRFRQPQQRKATRLSAQQLARNGSQLSDTQVTINISGVTSGAAADGTKELNEQQVRQVRFEEPSSVAASAPILRPIGMAETKEEPEVEVVAAPDEDEDEDDDDEDLVAQLCDKSLLSKSPTSYCADIESTCSTVSPPPAGLSLDSTSHSTYLASSLTSANGFIRRLEAAKNFRLRNSHIHHNSFHGTTAGTVHGAKGTTPGGSGASSAQAKGAATATTTTTSGAVPMASSSVADVAAATSNSAAGSQNQFVLTMHNKNRIESRQRAAKMLSAIVVLFGLCYLPVHLINFLRQFIDNIPQNDATSTISMLAHCICYLNSAINPIIYNHMNSVFRQEFRKFLSWRPWRRLSNGSGNAGAAGGGAGTNANSNTYNHHNGTGNGHSQDPGFSLPVRCNSDASSYHEFALGSRNHQAAATNHHHHQQQQHHHFQTRKSNVSRPVGATATSGGEQVTLLAPADLQVNGTRATQHLQQQNQKPSNHLNNNHHHYQTTNGIGTANGRQQRILHAFKQPVA